MPESIPAGNEPFVPATALEFPTVPIPLYALRHLIQHLEATSREIRESARALRPNDETASEHLLNLQHQAGFLKGSADVLRNYLPSPAP